MAHPLRPSPDFPALLTAYQPFDEAEAADVALLQHFLSRTDQAYHRSNLQAHVVADAWILDPTFEKVMLLKHGVHVAMGLDIWLAPGGHCDGNTDVYASAVREAEEECGLKVCPLSSGLFDVACSQVPMRTSRHGTEPAHQHFDVCFAFTADPSASLIISEESKDLGWLPVSTLTQQNHWPGHWRRVQKTRARWGFLF